ncbi:MAG: hypothetical protein WDA08_07670 [Weeksellaceae bacterium]
MFHSGWAYLTILMGVLFFVVIGYYAINKKARNNLINKLSLFTVLTFHIQMILGVILYFLSPYSNWNENTMKDSALRLMSVEHPLMMFAAVIFITIANSKLKKSEQVKMSSAILSLIALACMLAMIPWDTWLS